VNIPSLSLAAALLIAPILFAQGAPPGQGQPPKPGKTPLGVMLTQGFRTVDGADNNPFQPAWGATDIPFTRLVGSDYGDGAGSPAGADRPSARAVSNAVCAQSEDRPNALAATDMLWQWGQFLDHDIDLTAGSSPAEAFDIAVPLGDPWFDPFSTGTETIGLDRSAGVFVNGQREQLNEITAWIDGSMIYGSDEERALALRTLDGTGRLRTSEGDLLPYNLELLPNAPYPQVDFFLAGDIRANEQVALTALHTLFVREHNWWAERIARLTHSKPKSKPKKPKSSGKPGGDGKGKGGPPPTLSGDEIYQRARAIVGAEIQAITFREFLPVLLGKQALPKYEGYAPGVDPSIRNAFATSAYRVGHTMLSSTLLRLDRRGNEHEAGHLDLADAFFSPTELSAWGIEPLLRGLAHQRAQEVDPLVVDDVRNFLFGPPGAGGFDLASLNIQRGRDHGLPSLAALRTELELLPPTEFSDICSDAQVVANLSSVYELPADVDPWVGALAEDHLPGAMVGETLHAILTEQFRALRDGDRFWYERAFPKKTKRLIERQTLAKIIRRNTDIGAEIPRDVFRIRATRR
jgi:peroxidase